MLPSLFIIYSTYNKSGTNLILNRDKEECESVIDLCGSLVLEKYASACFYKQESSDANACS